MKKVTVSSFTLILVLAFLLAACTLSASDAPLPSPLATSELSGGYGDLRRRASGRSRSGADRYRHPAYRHAAAGGDRYTGCSRG